MLLRKPHQSLRPNASAPDWYQTYFVAVMESNRQRALPPIELAQRAIQDRVSQLQKDPACNPRELQDLSNASVYLSILLQHIGSETGNLLWD
jgi:hypothetical protein